VRRPINHLLAALLLGAIALSGCATWLYTDAPLGEPAKPPDPADWNGAWLDPASQTITWLRVPPDGSGIEEARSGGSTPFDCTKISFGKSELNLFDRQHSDWSMPTPRKDPATGNYDYGWLTNLLMQRKQNALILAQFSQPIVIALVRAGDLPGEVQPNRNVILRGLQKEHVDKLFATVPIADAKVAVRLPAALDPCHVTPIKDP
jgi:hypothetical protein